MKNFLFILLVFFSAKGFSQTKDEAGCTWAKRTDTIDVDTVIIGATKKVKADVLIDTYEATRCTDHYHFYQRIRNRKYMLKGRAVNATAYMHKGVQVPLK